MVRAINLLNIALMAAAAVPAWRWPFETFLFAYAFLGPLHYLTEISWLHDRSYFAKERADAGLFVAAAGLFTLWKGLSPSGAAYSASLAGGVNWEAVLVLVTFAAAAAMTFLDRRSWRLLVAAIALAVAVPLCRTTLQAHLHLLLIPTIVHVFVFTGAFILFGALKQKSGSGLLSLACFVAIPAWFLLNHPTADAYVISADTAQRAQSFRGLHGLLARLFGFDGSWGSDVALMRFIAWAYTYHYLNWFSKTKVIGWHEISKARAAAILLLYAAAVALYLHDWRRGLDALFFLSILHVLLEFPLNHQSFVGIGREIRMRLRSA